MSQAQQLVVLVSPDKTSLSVKYINIPKPEAHEVLVKIHATTQNPTDCENYSNQYVFNCHCLFGFIGKTIEFSFSNEGFVPGNDYAGIIEEVGSSVTKVKKGDRV